MNFLRLPGSGGGHGPCREASLDRWLLACGDVCCEGYVYTGQAQLTNDMRRAKKKFAPQSKHGIYCMPMLECT